MGSTALSKNSIVSVGKNQVSCDMGGDAAILNLNSGQYYGLNPVGATIWALIQEPKTVGKVIETLLSEYDVDPAICERDLMALLKELEEKGLVELRGGETA